MDQITYFSTKYVVNKHNSKFPVLLHFMAKYKVPWIFKWNYNLVDEIVQRHFHVKWWEKFNFDKVIGYVMTKYPLPSTTSLQSSAQTKPQHQPAVPIPQHLPAAQATQVTQATPISTVRLGSPSPSTGPSQIKRKSKSKSSAKSKSTADAKSTSEELLRDRKSVV